LPEGKHEDLINFGTFQKFLERLNGGTRAPVAKDVSALPAGTVPGDQT
jgi:hypothetical protein